MRESKIKVIGDEINVECPNCETWEQQPLHQQRWHMQYFDITSISDGEFHEYSVTKCPSCKHHFKIIWDYTNLVMSEIIYKGKEYPYREFLVIDVETNSQVSYKIASESLIKDMRKYTGIEKFKQGSVEEKIDQGIYYYLEDSKMEESGEYICKNHLDKPMTFIKELF